jgi:hypothetical protein
LPAFASAPLSWSQELHKETKKTIVSLSNGSYQKRMKRWWQNSKWWTDRLC